MITCISLFDGRKEVWNNGTMLFHIIPLELFSSANCQDLGIIKQVYETSDPIYEEVVLEIRILGFQQLMFDEQQGIQYQHQ